MLRRSVICLRQKTSTGLAGLDVVPNSRAVAIEKWQQVKQALTQCPKDAAYRVAVQKQADAKLQVLEKFEDDEQLTAAFNGMQVEEVIEEAEEELKLIPILLDNPPWEVDAADSEREIIIK